MNIVENFAENVFNDKIMKERLPADIYTQLKITREQGTQLDLNIASVVANAMKDWALEKGATHFTHWFQPMTSITAEKHDSFLSKKNGKAISEFSGKELTRGEADASSFPSGSLRTTFEARGYTSWDPNSYAFIKDETLCIPTAFCSYSGEALDKKTPLLRSMEALNTQALRILKLFGNTEVTRVLSTVGAEQEYFLIDKEMYSKRKDLVLTGRTLFGAKLPKGQELEDHYFGTIRPRVKAFMKELDLELWKLGVFAKTEHNEVAPCQHELAPIYCRSNVATDHNQLTMETMKRVAEKHNLVCLLHEKPFANINGSGKHNNWSLQTNTRVNLLEPGSSPAENAQFILFLLSVIKAVDEHQDLLRLSVASAGNDHRLGGNEAPPAIISMFIGDELEDILLALERGEKAQNKQRKVMKLGVNTLPAFPMDTTDRNRTSPFAFTGNKFEFRMLGSNYSISGANVVLNTIVADSLMQFADELENAKDFNLALNNLVAKTISEHKKIIFNGNNYSDSWVEEATKRGLLNLKSTDEAIPYFKTPQNIALFERHNVYTKREVESRTEIMLDSYIKTINIEALTMIEMAKREIYPATNLFITDLSKTIKLKKEILNSVDYTENDVKLLIKLSTLSQDLLSICSTLESLLTKAKEEENVETLAHFYHNSILTTMSSLRAVCDEIETNIGKSYYPMPTYTDILFSV